MTDIQTLNSKTIQKNLEREVAFHIKKKLNEKTNAEVLLRPSPLSQSRYVIVKGLKRGSIIRVSDHEKFINPSMSRYFLRHRISRSYYLFTSNIGASGLANYYPLSNIDKLVSDVVNFIEK